MAQGIQQNTEKDHSSPCCTIQGVKIEKCPDCGGQPRRVSSCKTCKFQGYVTSPCPVHAGHVPAGNSTAVNYIRNGGGAGYHSGNSPSNWHGSETR